MHLRHEELVGDIQEHVFHHDIAGYSVSIRQYLGLESAYRFRIFFSLRILHHPP